MIRHGSSHGLSVLICSTVATVIIKYFEPKLPRFFAWLEKLSEALLLKLRIEYNEFLSIILITAFLAFIWGIFFKISTSINN